jgi:cyclic pyranopterin phosphate synthase
MPEEEYTWLPRADILSFEELARLVDVFSGLGVDKVRITGGEPLLRRDLTVLVRLLAAKPEIRDLALTTNGILLPDLAPDLREAGLGRMTISLDTLDRERYRELTRRDDLERALLGIRAARDAGFRGTKINTVVMRGVNDDELVPLLDYAREEELELRFIEYMDVGGATQWSAEAVVPRAEILERLGHHYGGIEAEPVADDASAPAERFRLPDGTRFGVIASTTAPFCGSCNRSRLTADGMWFTCLYAPDGTDLRAPLRAGVELEELRSRILGLWSERKDRGAEERLGLEVRDKLASKGVLRAHPHLEMHTRGG